MAILKLDPAYEIRSGKHGGQCFQNSLYGPTIKNNSHIRRWRSAHQLTAKQFEINCMRHWRNMSVADQTNWENWVTAYPQPTIHDPAVMLTPYQNFIKRNYYRYLSDPAGFSFMTSPNIIEYSTDYLTPVVSVSDVAITIDCSFSLGDGNQDCIIFLSNPLSAGKSFGNTFWRFAASITNVNQSIDITEQYLANFGVLPEVGQLLFLSVVFTGADNGQFTFHELQKIIVQAPAPPVFTPTYGGIYNWYNYSDPRQITSSDDWVIPTRLQWIFLNNFLGGSSVAGGKLKESGLTYWQTPNTGADNSSHFNGRGGGSRFTVFQFINSRGDHMSATEYFGAGYYLERLSYNSAAATLSAWGSKKTGTSIRLLYVGSGTPTNYTGNDGKVYDIVYLNSQWWLADNLAETKMRNGDWINGFDGGTYTPIDNSTWSHLTTAAMSIYDDNLDNF